MSDPGLLAYAMLLKSPKSLTSLCRLIRHFVIHLLERSISKLATGENTGDWFESRLSRRGPNCT